MNRLIAFFARQGVFSDLLTFFVIVLGLICSVVIQREIFPNVKYDIITVSTFFPGASPGEVERLVTNPIEQEMKEVDGIKVLTSTSVEGVSSIVAQLDPDQTSESQGKADIKEVVDRINDLPEDAEEPLVMSIQSKLRPVIEIALGSEIPEIELRKYAKKFEKELEKIPEVAKVTPRGLRDLEIRVEAIPQKLAQYQISLDDLITALQTQNRSIPAGTTRMGRGTASERKVLVRTIGEFEGVDDVKNTVIRANDLAQTIRVKDVARVSMDLEEAKVLNRTDGIPSLSLTVLKKEKADAIKLVDKVKLRMNALVQEISTPITVTYVNDSSYFIRRRVKVLTSNLAIGLLLVLIVLTLMIRARVALIVSIGIPFSILGTIALFQYWGISINMITLIGLIIVVGMLVDDAVVVTENAVKKIEEGEEPTEGAIKGTQEIWAPVTASVMTTVVAFLPLMFMTGIFGKFVKYIPIGVVVALLISLIECYFILPHHIGRWINLGKKNTKPKTPNAFTRVLQAPKKAWENIFIPAYLRVLAKMLKRRYLAAGAIAGIFAFAIFLATTKMQFILFPPDGVEQFAVNIEAPRNTPLEKTSELVKPVEKIVSKLPSAELDHFVTKIGEQQINPDDVRRTGDHYAQIMTYLTPETNRERTAKEIIEALREEVKTPPGLARVSFERLNPGPPVGKPISIGVRGNEYEKIMPAVSWIEEKLKAQSGTSDIKNNYSTGKEELRVRINSAEAAAAGLSVANIGNTVRAAFEGIVATSIQKLDEEIDIRVSFTDNAKLQSSSLESIQIPNRLGNLIPLSRVASFERGSGIASYSHENNERQVRVTGDVDETVTSSTAVNDYVRSLIPEIRKKFPSVSIYFGGEDLDTQESMSSLFRAFFLAFFGVFLILVMTFKNLTQPFLVLFITLPLGLMSVIFAFFTHGMPLTFLGMLGVVALAGVIVNNAIVFMDFLNRFRAQGMGKTESIYEAAKARIRPIFLTTLTTACGILPTAYGIGGLDKFVVPIAMALGWGILFGSLLTSLIFPVSLAIIDDFMDWMNGKFRRNRSEDFTHSPPPSSAKAS